MNKSINIIITGMLYLSSTIVTVGWSHVLNVYQVFLMKDGYRSVPPVDATRINSTISITMMCTDTTVQCIARIRWGAGGGVTACMITLLSGNLTVPIINS